MSMKQDNCKT